MAAKKTKPVQAKGKGVLKGKMPTKRSINLVLVDENKINPLTAILGILLILVLAVVFYCLPQYEMIFPLLYLMPLQILLIEHLITLVVVILYAEKNSPDLDKLNLQPGDRLYIPGIRSLLEGDGDRVDATVLRSGEKELLRFKRERMAPGEMEKIVLPKEGLEELGTRKVVWSDLDGNGHLYSGRYGDIIWDFLPEDLQDKELKEFYINYSKEATFSQELKICGFREENTYRMEGIGPEYTCFTALCVY